MCYDSDTPVHLYFTLHLFVLIFKKVVDVYYILYYADSPTPFIPPVKSVIMQ